MVLRKIYSCKYHFELPYIFTGDAWVMTGLTKKKPNLDILSDSLRDR